MSNKSVLENIIQDVLAKFKSQGIEPKVTRLSSDWKLAEQYFDKFLKGLILIGLSELPDGPGNLLLFAAEQDVQKPIAQVEVNGSWIWNISSISSIILDDNQPFPWQDHSALISETNTHIGQKVIAFKLWEPLPHLALEFSDGSALVIHGDNGQYESWGFEKSPDSAGVYALPGGPIAVG